MTRSHRAFASWARGCITLAPAVLVAVVLALPGLAFAQGFPLGVRVDFPTGDVYSVALADLNGDHASDLIGANLNGGSVSVWLGAGGGAFGSRNDFAVPGKPYGIAVGDVNGDGKPDVVTANANATASVLLGNGLGGFATHVDYPTGSTCLFVALADLNGDGRLDIVTSNSNANTVSVLLGTGGGAFGPKTDFAVGNAPQQLALGDVDGDGIPDLVVANQNDNDVAVLIGNGAGGFGVPTPFATNLGPLGLVLTDLDNDGTLDIATCNATNSDISVLLGNGSGGFGTATTFASSLYPGGITVGDVNGDGFPDLVVSGGAPTNVVSVLPGNGAGGFGAHLDLPAASGPAGVAVGDANGDGRFDVAVAGFSAHQVSLLLAAPMPGAIVGYPSPSGQRIAMGDVNGDTLADLAVTNSAANTVSVDLSTPTGFGGWTSYPTASGPSSVAIGDQDGDGKADLFVTNFNANSVSVFPNLGSGTFGARTDGTGPHVQGPTGAIIGSFDGGGTAPVFADNLTFYVSLFAGTASVLDVQTATQPAQVAVADVDGDGHVDLVSGNVINVSFVPFIQIIPPPTRTDFTPPGGGPYGVALGDLDGDGKADIAVATQSGVVVYSGTSTGPSNSPTMLSLPPIHYNANNAIQIADLNGDGRLDIAVSFRSDSASVVTGILSEFLGDGAGGFGPRIDIHGGFGGGGFALGDVNGDGRRDLGAPSGAILLTPSATRTVLVASPSPVAQGSPVTLTATVQRTRILPSSSTIGIMKFFDGTTLLATAPVTWTMVPQSCNPPIPGCTAPTVYYGTATVSTRFIHAGAHALSAVYSGDGNRAGSITAPITEVVQKAALAVGGVRLPAFGLGRSPNPATTGRLRVAFSLPSAAPATLELYDLGGRRVDVRDVAALGAGSHELDLGADHAIASGVYFLRLRQGSRNATARLAVLN